MTMTQQTLVTRFNLIQITGNQVVDWAVVDGNFENLGNFAAHVGATGAPVNNSFNGNQLVAGNVGITGIHRRLTLPVPAVNETDRLMLMAESNSANGTYVGVCAPTAAATGQRRASLVVHGVEPTGTTTPLGLTLNVDEDNHRTSINATGTYQDATAPVLQLGAAGVDRITIPGAGAVGVVGNLTLTGNLAAVAGAFSTTLSVTGPTNLSSTLAVTGNTTLGGALTLVGAAIFQSSLSVATITSASVTLSGNLAVTGTTFLTGVVSVGSAMGVNGNLTVSGSIGLSGNLQFGGGAAYIQYYGSNYVQISQLTVTPGPTALAGLTVNGTTVLNGATTAATSMTVNSVLYLNNQTIQLCATLYGINNGCYLTNDGSTWTASGSFSAAGGNLYAGGTISSGSQVFTTPGGSLYLRGADGNVHIDSGPALLYVSGRVITGGWDLGQALNVNGSIVANGYIFNRGSTAYRCWDNADFTYSVANAGSTLVQRDGAGNITVSQCAATQFWNYGPTYYFVNNGGVYVTWDGSTLSHSHRITAPGVQCNGDMTVGATFYVMSGSTILFQVAATNGEVFSNSDIHCADSRVFFQCAAYNSYNGRANANAFLTPNVGNFQGQCLAQSYQTYSSGAWKKNVRTMTDGVAGIRKLRPVRYEHEDYGEFVGLIAEEVHEIFPSLVGRDTNGVICSMDYSRLTAPLLAATLEVIDRVETAEARIQRLTNEVADLRAKLAA